MKVILVRPPRYMWPFNSESSSFWQPLGFASIAAVLRENDFKVEILDCLPLKIGWASLRKRLENKSYDIIGIGEETSSSIEGLKLASLSKEVNPEANVVMGGIHFSYMVDDTLKNYPVDFIVRGEGEYTFLDLCCKLDKGNRDFKQVKGITYKIGNKIVKTESRPLIKNLDELPIPAYDLLPMDGYGKKAVNHPRLAAIEHGRGCVDSCSFCSLWRHMSSDGKPCYRTKSVERTMQEIDILVKKYKRKTLGWVDGTWNIDAKWNKEWAEAMIERDYDTWSTVWARADFIIRDERLGILKKVVDAGLVQVVIGLERIRKEDLRFLNKNNNLFSIQKEAFDILKKYPQIFTIASIIYGIPTESEESLNEIDRLLRSSLADMYFPLPYTPFPGTEVYNDFVRNNRQGITDFRLYNLHMPLVPSNQISREELERWSKKILLGYFLNLNQIKKIILARDKRKRKVHIRLAKSVFKAFYRNLFRDSSMKYGKKPFWYDL